MISLPEWSKCAFSSLKPTNIATRPGYFEASNISGPMRDWSPCPHTINLAPRSTIPGMIGAIRSGPSK